MLWLPLPPVRRLAVPRFGLVASCLAAVLAALPSSAAARAPGEEREPRLVLPGERAVRAGQWVVLRWAEADSILELEILLSPDGGRHYSVCISPPLDPARREFVWRVPPGSAGALRMRIRFNRGGREIEGAPTAPLVVSGDGERQPEPLGLPSQSPTGETVPRPSGRGEAPAGRSAPGALAGMADASRPRPTWQGARAPAPSPDIPSPSQSAVRFPFAAPRTAPLRA